MITEDYVSFETAKLLKEKGFEGENRDWYIMEGFIEEIGVDDGVDPTAHEDIFNNVIPAPTLQMAAKWLRENFNMNPVPYATSIGWYFEVFDLTQRDITGCALLYQVGIPSKEKTFETSEEACEAGIRYCLENLI